MIRKISLLAFALIGIMGCGDSVPENPKPTGGGNPHVEGSPQDRIKALEADTTLPLEERARRIQIIKDRNHLP